MIFLEDAMGILFLFNTAFLIFKALKCGIKSIKFVIAITF